MDSVACPTSLVNSPLTCKLEVGTAAGGKVQTWRKMGGWEGRRGMTGRRRHIYDQLRVTYLNEFGLRSGVAALR